MHVDIKPQLLHLTIERLIMMCELDATVSTGPASMHIVCHSMLFQCVVLIPQYCSHAHADNAVLSPLSLYSITHICLATLPTQYLMQYMWECWQALIIGQSKPNHLLNQQVRQTW